LGWDVAGVVEALGADVDSWAVGDEVVAMSPWFAGRAGTHAERVVLDATLLARAPRTVDAVAAATLPLNALTAAQALDLIDPADGSSLLVTGAAGAVGGYAVQLAAARGLTVVGTASAADEHTVRELGAKEFVQRGDGLVGAVRSVVPGGVDAVLDAAPIGGSALGAVRDGGAFVTVLDATRPDAERGVRVDKVSVTGDGARLAQLVDLLDRGVLTARVAGSLPLEEAPVAYGRVLAGGQRGRWVLVP
jgi:NADPH:quinone reductase-like Zn-dependent oxidoreductase